MKLLDNLTIGQYQALYLNSKSKDDEEDKKTQAVAIATGKTPRQIDEMPMHEFQVLSHSVVIAYEKAKLNAHPIPFLKSGKRIYEINYIPASYRYAQFVECQTWLKSDIIENMHNILASISNPVRRFLWLKLPGKNDSRNHEMIAEDFKGVRFKEAYGCIVFFCKVFAASMKGLEGYLRAETRMTKKEADKLMTDLTLVLDGFTTQSELQN